MSYTLTNFPPSRPRLTFPDVSAEHFKYSSPKITRQLTQRQLRQLTVDLASKQELKDIIVLHFRRPNEVFYIEKSATGWSIKRVLIDDTKQCLNIPCIIGMIKPFFIATILYYSNRTRSSVYLYDFRFPFFRDQDQEKTLKEYLPSVAFDYPSSKVSEHDYLNQLRKESKETKEALTFLPDELTDIITTYQPSAEQILSKRILEANFPDPYQTLVKDYLALDESQY